jgi:hypothetical protein
MENTPKPSSTAARQVKLAAIGAASAGHRAEALRLSLLAEGAIRWSREGRDYRESPRASAFTSPPMSPDGINRKRPKSAA